MNEKIIVEFNSQIVTISFDISFAFCIIAILMNIDLWMIVLKKICTRKYRKASINK